MKQLSFTGGNKSYNINPGKWVGVFKSVYIIKVLGMLHLYEEGFQVLAGCVLAGREE